MSAGSLGAARRQPTLQNPITLAPGSRSSSLQNCEKMNLCCLRRPGCETPSWQLELRQSWKRCSAQEHSSLAGVCAFMGQTREVPCPGARAGAGLEQGASAAAAPTPHTSATPATHPFTPPGSVLGKPPLSATRPNPPFSSYIQPQMLPRFLWPNPLLPSPPSTHLTTAASLCLMRLQVSEGGGCGGPRAGAAGRGEGLTPRCRAAEKHSSGNQTAGVQVQPARPALDLRQQALTPSAPAL